MCKFPHLPGYDIINEMKETGREEYLQMYMKNVGSKFTAR